MFRMMLPPGNSDASGCIPGALRRPGMGAYAEVGCGSVSPDAPPGLRLAITNLEVSFGERRVVNLAELAVGEAEIVGLAGESGSGKSMTTLAVLGLAHTVGARVSGSIRLD